MTCISAGLTRSRRFLYFSAVEFDNELYLYGFYLSSNLYGNLPGLITRSTSGNRLEPGPPFLLLQMYVQGASNYGSKEGSMRAYGERRRVVILQKHTYIYIAGKHTHNWLPLRRICPCLLPLTLPPSTLLAG
jgi:hypothetical protein